MRTRADESRAGDAFDAAQDPKRTRAAPEDRPSKTRRKRDMLDLQKLGASLLALADDRLASLPIDAKLLDAIRLAREIHSREGHRRQLQYIGRLMRDVDADALRSALSTLEARGEIPRTRNR